MAAKEITRSIGNALGVNDTMVDVLTLGATAVARETDKVIDDVTGVTKRKEESKKAAEAQAGAEAEAKQVQSDDAARRAAQAKMKEDEYAKRNSQSGGGRSGTVLGAAGMNANSGTKYKTLLGE